VDIAIRLDRNPGFAAMMLKIDLPQGISLVRYDVTNEDLLDGLTMPRAGGNYIEPNAPTNLVGTFYVGWTNASDIYTQEGLLILTLSVASNANLGDLHVNVTFANANGEEVPTNADGEQLDIALRNNGGIRVRTSFLRGDIDGDGRLTSADGTALARYLIGHIVTIDREAAAAITGGTSPSLTDLITLRRWLVGNGGPSE